MFLHPFAMNSVSEDSGRTLFNLGLENGWEPDIEKRHKKRPSPTGITNGQPREKVWVMSRWWPSQFCRFVVLSFWCPPLLRESVHQGLIVLGNMVGEQDKFSDWNQTCLITLFTLIFCYHVQLPFIPVTQASFELIQIHIRELAYLAMFLLILSGKWQTKSSNWYHSWRFYSLDRLLEEQRWVMLSDGTQTLCEESCDPLRILEYVQSKLKSTVTNNPPAISCAERTFQAMRIPCWWTAQLSPSHHQHNLLDVVACTCHVGKSESPCGFAMAILSLLVHLMKYFHASITCFTGPHPVFSSILYVHVSEMLCSARFPAVVHVSQQLCTFHRSCARFTSPLITFVFNCIHTERILISKSIGATKHVLPFHA